MKIALTSIQPPHTTNIFDGKKSIEWRKIALPLGRHDVYETKRNNGAGLVIGSMEIIRNYFFNSVDEIPNYLIDEGCVPRSFLKSYAGKGPLYANVICEPKRFETPRDISYYHRPPISPSDAECRDRVLKPPQSFMYAIDKETK